MSKNKQCEYSFDDKKRLASNINKIRNKAQLKRIKQIIYDENKDLATSKSNGGILMYFQNLSNNTYQKIDTFLTNIEKKKQKKLMESLKTSELNLSSDRPDNITDYSTIRNRLRLSNKEKRIMKKKEYEKDMNISTKEYDVSTLKNSKNISNDNSDDKKQKIKKKTKKSIEKIDIFS